MMRWLIVAGSGIIAAAGLVVGVGRSLWQRETARAVARLRETRRATGEPERAADSDRPAVPPPVQRYLDFALPERAAPVATAEIHWTGEFRMRPGAAWARFTAVQHFTTRPPGFVWDAAIALLPAVRVRVRDGYRAGVGSMLGRIGGVATVVDQAGTPELAQSALARWLGEAVWFPTALLPDVDGGAVRWEAIDDSTARAVVTDGAVTAAAEFRFADSGGITRMTARRYRDVDGTPVLTPFEGQYGSYVQRSGLRVPASAEVAWLLEEGRFAYWRGRPERIEFEPVTAAP